MNWSVVFFINSFLLGIGLAMDAFSVSLANGLNEPKMKTLRMCLIAGVYGMFQFLMPMAGWICVHTILNIFTSFQKFIPWIALLLLCFIGGKMIFESLKESGEIPSEEKSGFKKLSGTLLLVQGIATSIDALSVGFTIAEYNLLMAFTASLIIAAVTFALCMGALAIGKAAGKTLSKKAEILGGFILILIGIEIFIKNMIA